MTNNQLEACLIEAVEKFIRTYPVDRNEGRTKKV